MDESAVRTCDFERGCPTGVRRLDTTQHTGFKKVRDSRWRSSATSEPRELGLKSSSYKSVFEGIPPNLTLNIPGAVPYRSVTVVLAFYGLALQAAVMTINALGVYYWRWPRAGKLVAPYGYPLWAIGTGLLSIGTLICGWIVESSCWKSTICSSTATSAPAFTFFQKRIPEQNISGYAIDLVPSGNALQISRRLFPLASDENARNLDSQRRIREWCTIVGTVISFVGFIVQNVGTRQLHWSAGISQFILTVIMVGVRAWLRRNVGYPKGSSSEFLKLQEGQEACDFIFRTTFHRFHQPFLIGTTDHFEWDRDQLNVWLGHNMGPSLDPDARNLSSNLGAVASALYTHDLLGECEEDTGKISEMAIACYKAMAAIVYAIFGGDEDLRDQFLTDMTHFTYMMVSERDTHFRTRGLVPIRFPTRGLLNSKSARRDDHIRFLRAIIALNRHALVPYTEVTRYFSERSWRLVGTFPSTEVKQKKELLKALFKPHNVWSRNTNVDRQPGGYRSPLWQCFFWNARFSSEFYQMNGL